MSIEPINPKDRLLATLRIVHKESQHLEWSRQRLFQQPIDARWVQALDAYPERAERLEAFVSRYGRMQDTIAQKLLPRWLLALAEEPGSLLEVLNRAERLGVIENTDQWLEARQLRNRLVHEYMEDSTFFAASIQLAEGYCAMLLDTYQRLRKDVVHRLGIAQADLP
ncbi:MAG: hypothetical protein RBR52_10480 [Thiomonas sp.]|uniref:hypothetical protein n=1 Tax=Thiomonas sp. TaxID=2047785 RepID=UPI002A359266|nr:hypothetical protein [Thiomonas sp.]MDY0330909.1 hypothetical protein [Thiomonas sp.]